MPIWEQDYNHECFVEHLRHREAKQKRELKLFQQRITALIITGLVVLVALVCVG